MDFESFVLQSKEVQQNSIAPSTARTYKSLMNSYELGIKTIPGAPEPYPLNEEKVRGFLIWYKTSHPTTTHGYLKQFVVAFAHHLHQQNESDFTKNDSFQQFLKGLKHEMKQDAPPNAKSYIGKETMEKLISLEGREEIKALISVLYYGFLRISEGVNLKYKDVTYDDNGRMMLLIPFSKTDQSGKSVTVFISPTSTAYSPFIWLKNYIENTYKGNDEEKIFKKSIQTYRTQLKTMFCAIGLNMTKYSTHSFRKGAAHEASLAHVNDCQIKAMGRWISSCYTRYTSTTMREAGDSISSFI